MTMETQQATREVIGPVDYLIVRFPGNKFTGKIAPELRRLQDSGIVRVIDIILVRKDEKGRSSPSRWTDLPGEAGDAFRGLHRQARNMVLPGRCGDHRRRTARQQLGWGEFSSRISGPLAKEGF